MVQWGEAALILVSAPSESLGFDSSRRQQHLWGQQSENQDLKPPQELLPRPAQVTQTPERRGASPQRVPAFHGILSLVLCASHFLSQPWPVSLCLTARMPHEGEYIQFSSKFELIQTRNVFFLLQENRKLQSQHRARGGETVTPAGGDRPGYSPKQTTYWQQCCLTHNTRTQVIVLWV